MTIKLKLAPALALLVTERLARSKNVRFCDGRKARSSLREQIATQQRRGSFFHQKAAIPPVWQMRRIDPTHGVLAQRE